MSSKTPKHEREQDKKETIEHRKESRLTSPSAGRRFVFVGSKGRRVILWTDRFKVTTESTEKLE